LLGFFVLGQKKPIQDDKKGKEQPMPASVREKINGVWAGAERNTSDIPPEKIPLHARETVPMIKQRKPASNTCSR
jgi:hypothetical protein